jgi:hypothetical protein
MDKCHLCEKKRELKESHVWPAFAYKRYLTTVEAECMFHGFIDERLSVEVFDNLMHVKDRGTVGGSGNLQRLDVKIDDRPLMSPIIPDRILPVNVGASHAVRPRHVIGEQVKDALDVPSAKSVSERPCAYDQPAINGPR